MKKYIICCMISLLILGGCGNTYSDKKSTVTSKTADLFAMDTYMNLKVYSDNAEKLLEEAENRIIELESELSVTYDESDIGKINNSSGKPVTVCEDTLNILYEAEKIRVESENALDVSIYPVLRLWGFTTQNYRVPDDSEIEELLKNVNGSEINISDNNVTIPMNFKIDVGALAKGYTGDAVMDLFRENNVESAIISLGGNVQTIGKKTDGSEWSVAIVNPYDTTDNLGIVKVSDKAVITSGNYERFFTGDDGKNYCHIIDPSTGKPAENGFVSVTVIGSSGIRCDALSTALYIEGRDKAYNHWKEYGDFEMICVTDDMKLLVTEGIYEKFENLSKMETEVLKR